mgnify:CR=1 FL=1|jgi:hypothetical protein
MEHIVARADIFKFVTLRGCDAYQVCLIFKIGIMHFRLAVAPGRMEPELDRELPK